MGRDGCQGCSLYCIEIKFRIQEIRVQGEERDWMGRDGCQGCSLYCIEIEFKIQEIRVQGMRRLFVIGSRADEVRS
jgi:Pyruvate/2-oxoacid:ferredoxin oxidoreductase delta subunit